MSNYTKSTDFASKDSLPSGNSAKIVKGTEIDTEFNNIASAISTKADTASPAFSGTPTAPTASYPSNTTQIATTAYVTSAVTAMSSGLSDPGANGMVVRTATSVTTARTITGSSTVTVTNGDGVSGNPTLSVPSGGITATQLASGSVSSDKIASSAVTTDKIANSSVTEAKLSNIPVIRAWVNFDGTRDTSGAVSTSNTNRFIRAQHNVTSVLRNALGDYTITFTNQLSDNNYAVTATAGGTAADALGVDLGNQGSNPSQSTSQVKLTTYGAGAANNVDATVVSVMVIR